MAPFKKLRTYQNPKKKNTESIIRLRELVVNLTNIGGSIETSSDSIRETTFDRLKKGANYNNVVFTSFSKPNFSSSTDISYSIHEYKRNESVDVGTNNSNVSDEPSKCEQKVYSTSNRDQVVRKPFKRSNKHVSETSWGRSPIVTRSKPNLLSNSGSQGNIDKCYGKKTSNFSSSGNLTRSVTEDKMNDSAEHKNSNSNFTIGTSTCEQNMSSKNESHQEIQIPEISTAHILKSGSESPPLLTRSKFKSKSPTERCCISKTSKVLPSEKNLSIECEDNLEKNESKSFILSESSTKNNSAINTTASTHVSSLQIIYLENEKLIEKKESYNNSLHLNISGFKFKQLRNQCSTPVVFMSNKINKKREKRKPNPCKNIDEQYNPNFVISGEQLKSNKDNSGNKENSHLSNIETHATSREKNSNESNCELHNSVNMSPHHFKNQHHFTFEKNSLPCSSPVLTSTPLHKNKSIMDYIDISSDNGINFNAGKLSHNINSNISKFKLENRQVFQQINFNKNYNTLQKSNILNALENSENQDIVESSQILELPITKKFVSLAAGKKFRRSIIIHRNTMDVPRNYIGMQLDDSKINNLSRRQSIKVVPIMTIRDTISKVENAATNLSVIEENLKENTKYNSNENNSLICTTPRDNVLQRCRQTEPLNFDECYPESSLHHCQKIGEGVYGEVFMYKDHNNSVVVMKIIPIEGDQIVNLERQKTFEEIISEIVITAELSDLRKKETNKTDAFTEVMKIRCVKGCYPKRLLDLWDLYDENKQSENDSPEIFKNDQLYIVLELANGGRDLEAYEFRNAQQSLSVFEQIACAIAVAEEELHFEHRDLHWGNVLVKITKQKYSNFVLKGNKIAINNKEVKATIIDFTLSRIEYDGVVIFNDLTLDNDLFTATGDYQFEIYRLMKQNNGNEWQSFKPYSNILWLHYILDKAITAFRYKNVKSKLHQTSISALEEYKANILNYQSVTEFVMNNFIS